MALNQRVVLVERPLGQATPDCSSIEDVPLDELTAGQVRVAVQYVSVDAGTRTMLRGEGFHRQVGLGETVGAGGNTGKLLVKIGADRTALGAST